MGQQVSSLDYMKRFSLCNCLTVYFPETYTLHGVSLDVINKLAAPGKRIPQPYADQWEPHWGPRELKIPTTIDTFLYAPFVEMVSPSYIFPGFDRGKVRYVNGTIGEFFVNKGLAKRIPTPPMSKYQQELKEIDRKVSNMWGSVLKVLVFYNYERAEQVDARKLAEYHAATKAALLHWPIIEVELIGREPRRNHHTGQCDEGWLGWEHYYDETRDLVLSKIIALEKAHAGRG
jgi:hypothetical protein